MKYYLFTESFQSHVIRNDFIEIKISSVIDNLKAKLQYYSFFIYTEYKQITIDVQFMTKFVTKINNFVVDTGLGLIKLSDLKEISNVLSCSNIKVCFFNCLLLNDI